MSIHDLIFRLLSWIVPDKYEQPDPVSADARTNIAISVLQPVADKYGLTYRGPREWYSQEGPIRARMATAESAVAYLKEQIPQLPHYWRYDFYLPFLLKECGQQDEARAAMEDYLSKNPNVEPKYSDRWREIIG